MLVFISLQPQFNMLYMNTTTAVDPVIYNNWINMHYLPHDQARVLSHLIHQIDYYSLINFTVPFNTIFEERPQECEASKLTASQYWLHYELYGKLPHKMWAYLRQTRKKYHYLAPASKINKMELDILKEIINNWLYLFLSLIAINFGVKIGKYFHHTTLWHYISNNLNYSLQTLTKRIV